MKELIRRREQAAVDLIISGTTDVPLTRNPTTLTGIVNNLIEKTSVPADGIPFSAMASNRKHIPSEYPG